MDIIDVAQRRQQEAIDHALAARQTQSVPGRTHCAKAACGEAIVPVRQQMGAQLCIDCQRDAEQEARSWARAAV